MPDVKDHNGADVSDAMSDNGDESESYSNEQDKMSENNNGDGSGQTKKKYDPKDPHRPRRKKARRACYACQRAHLTCGDERPCKRCVKRGLADACQDGVRKKAKYLHDAPPEALRPVLGPTWDPSTGTNRPPAQRQNSSASTNEAMSTPSSTSFSQGSGPTFPVYGGGAQGSVGVPDNMGFNPQASPVSPTFQANPTVSQPQMGSMLPPNNMDFNALFDPSNPALYNFDLEGLNFGSQYAGWEFGILNKMTIGAETPPRENSLSQTPTTEPSYAAVFGNGGQPFEGSNMMTDFSGVDQNNPNLYSQGNLQHGLPHAYAIAAGPTSLASPSTEATSSPQPGVGIDASPKPGVFGGMAGVSTAPKIKTKNIKPGIMNKTQRDSAKIYESVTEPYPYTAGFHNMIAVLRSRLPINKLLKIAMALGEIRPSFIACTKDLTREDLVFMEKCFQRTLVEFDDFLQHCAAPTVVCRRSGEVVAANKEFTALTGWTKDVLLGKEPNRNVYFPSNSAPASTDGDARSGATTPRPKKSVLETNSGRPQPVFLAELMDDDTAVDFYRDYSSLAFEDSRGKVQRSGRVMKYQTQEMLDAKAAQGPHKDPRAGGILSNRVTRIDGDLGISQIEKDGKVHCSYCWTIKRDVFDIPMMIIINFLPRFYPNEEPQAV